MSRLENKQIMGYFPIEERHYPALLSLVAPATPAVRLLDPFAGEGAFLEAAARAWNVTPYANELDGDRAAACLARFGATQAVRCDVERLVASNNAFGAAWLNPPYDHDAGAVGSKRVEFRYLRHAWKWVQDGGLALWQPTPRVGSRGVSGRPIADSDRAREGIGVDQAEAQIIAWPERG
jgi:tRNA G10  N-methylase Trm11